MRSIVAVTNEIDDVVSAVRELREQVEEQGPLGAGSVGFVFCDAEMPHDGFIREMKEKFPFDIVGSTGIATFDTKNGTQMMSAALLVLTGDDVSFGASLTGELSRDNLESELRSAYERASSSLGGVPEKMMFLIPPFAAAAPLDAYVSILNRCSGGLPIFGGLPSSSIPDMDIVMFADGGAFMDRAAIVLMGGDVRPLFSVQNILSTFSQAKHEVTDASENVVRGVDNMTFIDYLRKSGLSVDELIAQKDLAVYVSTPLIVNLNVDDADDGVPVVRTIQRLDPSDGSGVLFGSISKHSKVSLASMKRNDIQESAKALVDDIKRKIAEVSGDGYRYSTLFCVSCGGRYMVMADDKNLEGDILLGNLPEGLELAGFYAYGEVCPTVISGGKALNRVHNESIVICAL
ncbi:MAG: FIST C-terminal domain-containing protein [Synergistaceae bacterium]|jgi:hypothetical protein|nr:FIST C-terminal domain-containing protein [Synergistaceae bacterium]